MAHRSSTWPAITYEALAWEGSLGPGTTSRTQMRSHQGPYRAAITPGIAGAELRLPSDVLAIVDDAASEVSRFDVEMGGEIAPFATVLLRSESAASSRIENLTASARAISEAEIGVRHRANATEIVGNVAAMNAALALVDGVTEQAILEMHTALLHDVDPGMTGRWREQQVWVGGSNVGPHLAAFVPPSHERVPAAIADLISFIDRDDLPVLAHVAIAHAQFETIHPFPDGNGRTGRALMHAMLRGKGLARNVTVPISAGLLTDVDRYFEALGAYRQGDPVPIVTQLTDASYAAIANGRQLVGRLRDIRADWQQRINVRRGANAWKLADLLVRLPVVNAAVISRELGIPGPNVYRSLAPLEEAGVLTASTARRDRVWRAQEVLDALDEFAARARRRHPDARDGHSEQLAELPDLDVDANDVVIALEHERHER